MCGRDALAKLLVRRLARTSLTRQTSLVQSSSCLAKCSPECHNFVGCKAIVSRRIGLSKVSLLNPNLSCQVRVISFFVAFNIWEDLRGRHADVCPGRNDRKMQTRSHNCLQ